MAPLLMGSPRSPLSVEASSSPTGHWTPSSNNPPGHFRPGSHSSSGSGSWPGLSRWLRVSERNAFCADLDGPLLIWTLSDFMMPPEKCSQSNFGCTESFPLISSEACDAVLREVHSEAPDGGGASAVVGLGRNSLIRSLFVDSDIFGNLINRLIDVPVVARPEMRVHHLRPDAAPEKIEFVRDGASSFVCVVLLTPVPADGTVCSYLRRWDGAVETLSFPPGPAGAAFLLHGSQIDHTVLPWADHEASVLYIPIHPADGWIADEELCSTVETEVGDSAWSDDEPVWGQDPRLPPAGGKPRRSSLKEDLRVLAMRGAHEQFIMDP